MANIEKLLKKYFTIRGSHEITDDGVVVTGGCEYLRYYDENNQLPNTLPIKFKSVSKYFICSGSSSTGRGGLTTLEGCPSFAGSFSCGHNLLTTLIGGPIRVSGAYLCDTNLLHDLVGAPESVGEWFDCSRNDLLTSLKGAPKYIGGVFYLNCNATLPVLSLLKYENVCVNDTSKLKGIISKYCSMQSTPLRSRIIQCQRELIDNGFEGNARL